MPGEFKPPTATQILKGIVQTGVTPEEIASQLRGIQEDIEVGVFRTDLSCWETKELFFDMAQRMYVEDKGFRNRDAEIGIHLGGCKSPLCRRMQQAYYEILRPSQETDAPYVAEALTALEQELMSGTEIEDLVGKPTDFKDSDTGEALSVIKAVEITRKCKVPEGDQVLLVYFEPIEGMMVEIRGGNPTNGIIQVSFILNDDVLTPADIVFGSHAEAIGIDPKFFHAIVYANAPRSPRVIQE